MSSKFGPISEERLPASANQERLVKADLSSAGSYGTGIGHTIEGPFDEFKFNRCVNKLVARNATLRTRFEISGGQIEAVVSNSPVFRCHVWRTDDKSFGAFRAWAMPLIRKDINMASQDSMVSFLVADYGSSWRCYLGSHPAIADGVSFDALFSQLFKSYAGIKNEDVPQYYDFTPKRHTTKAEAAAITSMVDKLPDPVRLIGDGITADHGADPEQFVSATLPDASEQLQKLSKTFGTTKFGILLTVYALALRGFSGESAISIYFQSAGRRSLGVPNTVSGCFSNSLPLDLSVDLEDTIGNVAQRLRTKLGDVVALENTSLVDAVVTAKKQPRFAINMSPVNFPMKAGSLVVGPQEYLDRYTDFDLNLTWLDATDRLIVHLFFNPRRISKARAKLFLDFQKKLIRAILDQPDATCGDLLTVVRRARRAVALPQTGHRTPAGRIHDDFFDWAARTPDAKAILTSNGHVTYAELAEQARDVARAIGEAGVRPQETVAIVAQRNTSTVAAMLGTSAYGSPFALVDASYPAGRIEMMLEQLNTPHVLDADDILTARVASPILRIALAPSTDQPLKVDTGCARARAYHLFTSGTSGRPKLCTHPDTTLLRFIQWQAQAMAVPGKITSMMMSGLAHDPTLRDVFLPLSFGGCIALPSPTEMTDPAALRRLINASECNIIRFSASLARLVTSGAETDLRFPAIRGIFWGGERVSKDIASQWKTICPNARQFNVFGTTETPQAFAIHEIESTGTKGSVVPIGLPLSWTGIRIVDEKGAPVSVGEVGEIVADLADPVFGVNPGMQHAPNTERRTHFTGDRGYQMTDGLFYFAGRRDRQVKLNGFRIELEEIEAVSERVDGVIRAHAIHTGGATLLFVECGMREVLVHHIKSALYRQLPAYMIPVHVLTMERFPLTPNGKIDDAALINQAQSQMDARSARNAELPKSPNEEKIANVIERHTLFGRPYRHQSLLDFGADSLTTIEVGILLEQQGVVLPEGWTTLPISELAKHAPAVEAQKQVFRRPNAPTRTRLLFSEDRIRPIRKQVGRIIRALPGGSALLRLKPRHSIARQLCDMMAVTPNNHLARRNLLQSLDCIEPNRLAQIFARMEQLSNDEQRARLEKLAPFWHIVHQKQQPVFQRQQLSTHCDLFLSQRDTQAALICFPGNRRNMFIQFTRLMMILGNSDVPPVHLVILRSKYPGSYGLGVPGLGSHLGESLKMLGSALETRGIVTRAYLGASIGGFFALRAGLLDADAAAVSLGGRFPHVRGAGRLLHMGPAFDPLLCPDVPAHHALHCVYGSEMKFDRENAELLKRARPEVNLHPVSGVRSHNPMEKRVSQEDLMNTVTRFALLARRSKEPFEFP